jgi:ACS family D-galactonate transporter-like MFS transporter
MSKTTGFYLERPTRVRWEILALLMAFSFMSWLNRTSIAVAYDLQIQKQFAISEKQIGMVYSAFFLAYAIFMTPGGWLADRLGARAALLVVGFGSALFAALTGYLGFLTSSQSFAMVGVAATANFVMTYLLVVRFAMGLFTAPIYPASGRAVGHWMPPDRRASANGLITGAALVGNASSFVILGELIDWLDWPGALTIAAYLTASVAILWALKAKDHPDQHAQVNNSERRLIAAAESLRARKVLSQAPERPVSSSWVKLLSNRSLLLLTLSYAAVGYFEYLFFFWMHHYFVDVLHLDKQLSRYYTCIALLAMAGGMVLGGRLSDRLQHSYGRRWARLIVAAGGMLAGAVLLICGLAAAQPVWIVVWFSLSLAAVGASEGPFWTTAIELGDRYSGTAFGIFNTGGNLGGLLAPSVTPFVCDHLPTAWDEVFRWKLAISLGSVVCILGAALWWKIDPNAETK